LTPTTNKPRPARPQPIQPPKGYHPGRLRTHLICFLIFCALPFFDIVRFDIPHQRFYFAGQELWISEFGIIFLTLMFLLFCIIAVSMIFGRLYCSYACPQMIFSEASLRMQNWIERRIKKHFIQWSPKLRGVAGGAIFYSTGLIASTFLAFVFISYFVEPHDLFNRLTHFDIVTAGGIGGAVTTLLTFLDFAFLRQRFCTTVCPYGYLQGMLGDKNTLLVHYRDESLQCIECKKCVRICHMGIDIRQSPFQIECIHCGECVDACNDVLARLGKPGLIQFAWGEKGEAVGTNEPWYRRIGVRDAKRMVVLAVIFCYGAGLSVALSMRKPVFVRVEADRSVLFTKDASGATINTFRVIVGNRSRKPATVTLSLDGLEHASIIGRADIPLTPGAEVEQRIDVAIPAGFQTPDYVSHFRILALTEPSGDSYALDTTFIMPRTIPPSTGTVKQ
jgi:cytochrome c oxidase accessory protein FixG